MATRLPSISVITPTYNQIDFIQQTIQSVLEQNYPALEYIIVDGGSTDGTVDILKSYGDRVRWISEKDRGQSHAINKGLRLATGEVIAFLNSDDLYEPGSLLQVGEFFANYPEASWVTGKCRVIDERRREIRRALTLYKNFWLHFKNYGVLLVINYISQPATFWRKNVLDRIGYFNESLYYTMDYEYWLRVGNYYRLWFLNKNLATFRMYSDSKSGSNPKSEFKEQMAVVRTFSSSPLIRLLKSIHNALTIAIYKKLA